MKLYATADPNNTIAKRLEVRDDNGAAHITKILQNGKTLVWTCPNVTPREWVEYNTGRGRKWSWVMEEMSMDNGG